MDELLEELGFGVAEVEVEMELLEELETGPVVVELGLELVKELVEVEELDEEGTVELDIELLKAVLEVVIVELIVEMSVELDEEPAGELAVGLLKEVEDMLVVKLDVELLEGLDDADGLVVDTVLEELDETRKLVGVFVDVLVRVLVTVLVEVMVLVLLDSAELEEDDDVEGGGLELDGWPVVDVVNDDELDEMPDDDVGDKDVVKEELELGCGALVELDGAVGDETLDVVMEDVPELKMNETALDGDELAAAVLEVELL